MLAEKYRGRKKQDYITVVKIDEVVVGREVEAVVVVVVDGV